MHSVMISKSYFVKINESCVCKFVHACYDIYLTALSLHVGCPGNEPGLAVLLSAASPRGWSCTPGPARPTPGEDLASDRAGRHGWTAGE